MNPKISKIKELSKKVGIEIWWVIKRHVWIIPLLSIMAGKYVEAIPLENIVRFLERNCLPYVVFLPLVIVLISILSHLCSDSRKILLENRPFTVILYGSGVLVVLLGDWLSLSIFALMLFPHAHLVPFDINSEQRQSFYEYWFGFLIVPLIDWYNFRFILPKRFGEMKNIGERLICHIITAPGKNLIPSAMGFSMLFILLTIIC